MKELYPSGTLRPLFNEAFPWGMIVPTARNINVLALISGLEALIAKDGAVIVETLALALNNTYSQGMPSTRSAYRKQLRRKAKIYHYLPQRNIQQKKFPEAMAQAFGIKGKIKMVNGYGSIPFFQSELWYMQEEVLQDYLQQHFEKTHQQGDIHYFRPLFSLEGFL